MSGNTTQKTYEGYNLFNEELLISSGICQRESFNGVDCYRVIKSGTIDFKAPQGTYNLTFDFGRPNGYDIYSYIYCSDGTRHNIVAATSDVGYTESRPTERNFTTTSEIVRLEFGVYNYIAKPMYFSNFMLKLGEKKPYEPYVGGISSPNPDYPQVIENVSTSRNMFDESIVTVGKHISAEGVEGNSSHQRLSDYIEIEPNTTYRLSDVYNEFTFWDDYNSGQAQYDRCACYDESKTLITVLFNLSRNQKGQHTTIFSTPENARYIRITQGKFAEKTMLTKGEPFVPYAPFGGGTQLVLYNKNLIDDVYNVLFHTSAYGNRLKKEEKDGRNCIYYLFNTNRKYVIEGGFKTNTPYTISFDYVTGKDVSGSATRTPIITVFYKDGTRLSLTSPAKEWEHIRITTSADKTIDCIGTYTDSNVEIWIDRDTFMLQEGAVSDPVYEPYFREEIVIPTSVEVNGKTVPLRFAGSDKVINNRTLIDKLTVDRINNKVKYHQEFEIYEMTKEDEETWYNAFNIGEGAFYASFILQAPSPLNSIGVAKCNYATNRMVNPTSTYYFDIWYRGDGATALDLNFTNCESIDEMLNIIASKRAEGNPYTFQYPLAEPIEHDITDSPLADSLLMLATQNGTNTVEITGNLTPTLTVKHLTHS